MLRKMFQIALLIFLVSGISCEKFLIQRSIRNECPAAEEIPKCTCSQTVRGLSVSCKGIEKFTELNSHLKSLQGYSLKKLEINKCTLDTIPTDLWKGLEVEDLALSFVEVKDASFRRNQRHFQGLENSLKSLIITKSFKGGRPLLNLQLDHLKNLEHAIFEDNEIPEVGNDWFSSGLEKLSTLIFERNAIEELGDQAFSPLSNLKLLAVSGNDLNEVTRSMLPKSAMLTTLDLAYNKIRTLPRDIFSNMPLLQDVNMDYNLIHMIPQDTWGTISSQITALSLNGNVLQCDEKMRWICQTNMKTSKGKCSSPLDKKGLILQQFCNL